MASRDREFSSQAPAPAVADILSTGIFPATRGLLDRGLSNPAAPDSNPFSYTGQRIADFDPREQRAFGLTDQAIGSYLPFLQTGTDVLGQSADVYRQGIGQRFDPTSTDEFFNPFLDRVAGRVEDRVGKFIADRTNRLNLGAARTGNVGSARQGIAEADITKQGIEGLTDALGSLYSRGFDTAQNLAFTDFTRGADRDRALGASLADISGRTFNVANQLPNLQRQDISSLFSTGGLGRNRNQSLLDLDYQNFVGRYNLPFQNLQNVGNILAALGPLAGGFGYAGTAPAETTTGGLANFLYTPRFNNNFRSGIMGSNRALNPSLFPQGAGSVFQPTSAQEYVQQASGIFPQGVNTPASNQVTTTLAGNTYSPPSVTPLTFGDDTDVGPGGVRY